MADVILETRKLSKEFRGFTAVSEVDLRVERGHIHALIGPNGAGKTTCFNLLTRFLAPTRGQIFFNGRDITAARPAQVARMGIVRSFQISAVFPHLTVGGGTVVGSVKHPLSASDFSSFLLQAQASKAQVLGMANAGGDLINAVKAANEFGLTKKMKVAGLLVFINDVHTLGLNTTQGMYLTDGWYWDRTPESRAWAKRYFAKMKKQPSMLQAGDYSATMHFLNAVKATGSDNADKVMAHLKATPINDMFAKNGVIRPDGRMVYDMYLMQVKSPKESKGAWITTRWSPPFRGSRRTRRRRRPSARCGSEQ